MTQSRWIETIELRGMRQFLLAKLLATLVSICIACVPHALSLNLLKHRTAHTVITVLKNSTTIVELLIPALAFETSGALYISSGLSARFL